MSELTESKMRDVLDSVFEERKRQDAKWGSNRDFLNGTGGFVFEDAARDAKQRCDDAARAKVITWRHIADEEFAESLAESDDEKLEVELIQTAAVLVAWVEAIRSRRSRNTK